MKQAFNAKSAPKALGPYSHANLTESLVFVSGQLGIDPETGILAEGIEQQTRTALQNLQNVLKEAGTGPDAVVKTTVFVKNLDDFSLVNQIYGELFGQDSPARSCIEVSRLPAGAAVEIEAIAVRQK